MIQTLLLSVDEFITKSQNSPSQLFIINFKGSFCIPCKTIYPFIEYLSDEYKNVEFYAVDINDEIGSLYADKYNISKIPTFLFIHDGLVIDTYIGTDKKKIEDLLNQNL